MIQRIQTLYLFIIFSLMVSMFFLNTMEVTCKAGESTNVEADGSISRVRSFQDNTISLNMLAIKYSISSDKQYTWTSAIILLFATILPLFNIFTFHHRQFQLKMCYVEGVLQLGIIAFEILYIKTINDYVESTKLDFTTDYGISAVFPVIAIILLFLAGRGIIKDEALVASYDRLR